MITQTNESFLFDPNHDTLILSNYQVGLVDFVVIEFNSSH